VLRPIQQTLGAFHTIMYFNGDGRQFLLREFYCVSEENLLYLLCIFIGDSIVRF